METPDCRTEVLDQSLFHASSAPRSRYLSPLEAQSIFRNYHRGNAPLADSQPVKPAANTTLASIQAGFSIALSSNETMQASGGTFPVVAG